MKLLLNGFRVSLANAGRPLPELVARELGIERGSIEKINILRESVDARKRFSLAFVYNLEIELIMAERQLKRLLAAKPSLRPAPSRVPEEIKPGGMRLANPPVVVGSGPAGFFAALTLASYGYKPLLLERGDDVETRTKKVREFWQGGDLDPESNVQFGEGGAGTFSDGKLTTRIEDRRITQVLETFVANGAPAEILCKHKPHVGTDKLRGVVKGMRRQVEEAGGRVRFRAKLTGISVEQGRVAGVIINGEEEIPAQAVILAIGHSARDTYGMLRELGVALEPKSFAIGLRVEHRQGFIDEVQFGEHAGNSRLGPADYQLAYQDAETGRAAYAFCMCPGGTVVAAASEAGMVVTNGMSEFARDKGSANSALVVTVHPDDFDPANPLGGIELQRRWERKAFRLGGGNYHAPVQSIQDFLQDRSGAEPELKPSYLPGAELANLREALPKEVGEALGRAIMNFDRKISGFASEPSVLTGVETRTSAPVRIPRDETLQAVNLPGLYPAGEGAGYAGGIMSAAVDGIKAAEALIRRYAPDGRRN